MHDAHEVRWKIAFVEQVGDRGADFGCHLTRLQDDRVARKKTCNDLPKRNRQGEVPGRDDNNDAKRDAFDGRGAVR